MFSGRHAGAKFVKMSRLKEKQARMTLLYSGPAQELTGSITKRKANLSSI